MSRRKSRDTVAACAPCPHRPTCPGCPRYGEPGLAPSVQGELKELAREAGLPTAAVVEGAPFGYRHRARLAVRGRARSPKVGLFQAGSHRIADIPRCPIQHPLINRVAADVRDAVRASDTAPYADRPHAGLLRYVQIAVERPTERAQLVVVCNAEHPESALPFAEALRTRLGDALHSLWWNGNPERTNTILGSHWQRLFGDEALREEVGGVDIFFPPGAFGQSNLPLADAMGARIASWVPDGASVIELYAGCGAIGVPMLGRCGRISFNERGEDALRGLALSLAARPPAEQARARVHPGDAGATSELLGGFDACDVVIVDPPRRGLDEAVLEALLARPPRRLIYAACGLPAFLAQARRLLRGGALQMVRLEAYAMLPHTEHAESLALFERGSFAQLPEPRRPASGGH